MKLVMMVMLNDDENERATWRGIPGLLNTPS
jgi:hypothetical protein